MVFSIFKSDETITTTYFQNIFVPQIETLYLLAVILHSHIPLHGFPYPGHFIYVESCNICPFVPGLSHLAKCF